MGVSVLLIAAAACQVGKGLRLQAQGQTVEVSWSAITSLQPSRSWAPQVGLILATYF